MSAKYTRLGQLDGKIWDMDRKVCLRQCATSRCPRGGVIMPFFNVDDLNGKRLSTLMVLNKAQCF